MADQPTTFTCPACGAPLNPPQDGYPSMNCPFCKNSVVVPAEFRAPPKPAEGRGASQKAALRQVMALIKAGKKLEAIAVYRQHFETDLAGAKAAVEALSMKSEVDMPMSGAPSAQRTLSDREAVDMAEEMTRRIEAARAAKQQNTAVGRQGGCITTIIALILLAVGIGVFFMIGPGKEISSPADIVTSLRQPPSIFEPAVLIENEDAAPDIVVQSRRYDTDPYTTGLARISGQDGKILWESDPFKDEDAYLNELVSAGPFLLAVVEDQLIAYQASDGKLTWQIKLSDKLGYCGDNQSCLKVYGKMLLVASMDDTLQAYDIEQGKPLWSRQVSSTSEGIRLMKGQVVVYERDEQNSKNNGLVFLTPDTGKETLRITPQEMYSDAPIYFDEASNSLLIMIYSQIEKWDLSGTEPKQAWQTEVSSSMNDYGLLGPNAFYVNNYDGLQAVALDNGKISLLVKDEDYELQPLAIEGDLLLVLAKRTRGSTRYELWGLNATSGERSWVINMDEHTPLDDFSGSITDADTSPWLWKVSGGDLTIVQFQIEPAQIAVVNYNLDAGKRSTAITIPLDQIDDTYFMNRPAGWQGSTLWLVLDYQVYGIDVEKGKIILSAP